MYKLKDKIKNFEIIIFTNHILYKILRNMYPRLKILNFEVWIQIFIKIQISQTN